MAVYFVQDGHGHVKIGSSRNPQARLRALQSARADVLVLVRVIEGDCLIEHWFHRHFDAQRIRGEWFVFHPDMLTVNASEEPARPVRLDPIEHDALALVQAKIKELGTQMRLARLARVSPQYLTDVLKGRRTAGAKLLKACGYKVVREIRPVA